MAAPKTILQEDTASPQFASFGFEVIVADTNLVSYLLIEGERTNTARRVRERDANWRLPPLWRSEFLNVLPSAVRGGVLYEQQALSIRWFASHLSSGHEAEPTPTATVS